jgi:hypothetical protein
MRRIEDNAVNAAVFVRKMPAIHTVFYICGKQKIFVFWNILPKIPLP